MSLYVVDSSVAAKWFAPEPHSEAALRVLAGAHELHAPDFFLLEMVTADQKLYDALAKGPFAQHVEWVENVA